MSQQKSSLTALTIKSETFTKNLFALLQETFEKVEGIYLDRATSLSETLTGISAVEASRPIAEGGTTIAGQVDHIRFYLRVLNDYMDGKWQDKLDWKQSWLRSSVTESEWKDLQQQLKDDYRQLLSHLQSFADASSGRPATGWDDDRRLGGALATVVHTAYHLGAIRQILRRVKT